jgi:hypothetical protein
MANDEHPADEQPHTSPLLNFDFLAGNIRENAILRTKELSGELDTVPYSPGSKYLKIHYSGGKLTARQRILAKCADCACYYVDGREDCEVYWCPLYPYMPYGKLRKRYAKKTKQEA